MKKIIQVFYGVSLLLAVFIFWFFKVRNQQNLFADIHSILDTIVCCAYIFWGIFELKISFGEKAQKYVDYGSRELYGACQSATILLALWFYSHNVELLLMLTGAFIFAIGIAVRVWSVLVLGKYYSHSVRYVNNHKIVDTGPYKAVRHPAYSGMLLIHLGVVIYFFNLPALFVYVFGLLPAIVVRIFVEEKMLMQIEGYKEFSTSRKRIIPGIW